MTAAVRAEAPAAARADEGSRGRVVGTPGAAGAADPQVGGARGGVVGTPPLMDNQL